MSWKRFISKIKIRKRKEKKPRFTEIERNLTDIFLNILRRKDSILLNSNESKKIIIKYKNISILLDKGLFIINTKNSNDSILISEDIENFLLKEFNKIKNKKIYRTEINIQNNINNDFKQILEKLKTESHNTNLTNSRVLITE